MGHAAHISDATPIRHGSPVALVLRALAYWLAQFCLYALVNRRLHFLNRATARVFAWTLAAVGMDARADGDFVTWHGHRQSFTIVEECTAVFGFSIYAAFVLATPATWRSRGIGLAAGGLALVAINQLRLLGLALVQTYIPSLFDLAHEYLWQVVFVVAIAVVFLAWLERVRDDVGRVPR